MPRAASLLIPLSIAALVGAGPAPAMILGGGSPASDCYVFLDGVRATDGAQDVVCMDGDACDADGVRNGECSFDVRVCVNASRRRNLGCVRERHQIVSIALDNLQLDLPELPSDRRRCGDLTRITVPLRGLLTTTRGSVDSGSG